MNQEIVGQNKEDFTSTLSLIANQKMKIFEVQEIKVKQIIEQLKIQQEKNIQKEDQNVEIQQYPIVNLKEKPYEIIQEYIKKQSDWCEAIANKHLLLNKNYYCGNLIRKQSDDFIQEQLINFNTGYIYSTMTDDFKYLITWDSKSEEFQVRKQK